MTERVCVQDRKGCYSLAFPYQGLGHKQVLEGLQIAADNPLHGVDDSLQSSSGARRSNSIPGFQCRREDELSNGSVRRKASLSSACQNSLALFW